MKKTLSDPVIKFFVSVVGLFVILFVLKELQHIFLPFVIAYFLFFIFEPLNNKLTELKVPLGLIIFVNILVTVTVLGGISQIIIDAFVQFGKKLPLFEGKLNHIVSSTAVSFGIKEPAFTDFKISGILENFDYSSLASGIFASTIDALSYIFLILFFFIFISGGHDKIVEAIRLRFVEKGIKSTIKKMKRELSDKHEGEEEHSTGEDLATMTIQREIKLQKTYKDITEQVQKYIVTKFFISLLLGVVIGLVTWSFRIEFFVIWATLSIVLNFIPNIGSVIAVLLISVMSLIQYESFGYTFLIAATLILIQNIIGNILEPKIFGNRLGLNPLVILFSLMLWGYLWGIIGMFLSVPLTAVIKIIISNSSSKNMRFITNLMSN
ncbi:MAG: AI-2E family transporter [Ignavibacteriales bacterium]|nr:AI-2E family transporter [Ignavibacteriales bacterium]